MLKQGQKLKHKGDGEKCHIGGVCGEVYFVVTDLCDISFSPRTEREILKQYDLIEEKWEPEGGEEYWFLDDGGRIDNEFWDGGNVDIFRRDNLGIYRTKEEVPTSYHLKK